MRPESRTIHPFWTRMSIEAGGVPCTPSIKYYQSHDTRVYYASEQIQIDNKAQDRLFLNELLSYDARDELCGRGSSTSVPEVLVDDGKEEVLLP